MWFIGVEVEQETSAPHPKKNPGSAPEYVIIIPREAPSREVYNLVAREARVYHTSIARPA